MRQLRLAHFLFFRRGIPKSKGATKNADGHKRESEYIMKKFLLFLALIVTLVICFSACGRQLAHTHQYGEWTTTKTPTCTEDGIQTRYCSCGEKQVDVIYATGHKEQIIPGKEATCISDGLTEGKFCSKCGEILVPQEKIPAKGHTEKIIPRVESTCTEKGLTEGKECLVCQTVLVAQEFLPLKDHVEVIDAEVAATCIKTGLTEGKHCSVCSTVIVARQEIPVAPHTYDDEYDESCNICGFIRDPKCDHRNTEVISGKNATCTEIGYTNGRKCSKCGEILVAQEVIEATGHGENLKRIEAKDPTFDATGNYEYWKCSKCGKSYNDAKATNEIEETSTVIPVVPSYTITFVDRENQEDKTEKYSQNESLFISNKPTEMEGYAFVAWYTEDGKLVEYIAKGNAENYILYAKREAIRYSITYVDTPINNNVKTYTIEDEVQLTDPEWIGLSFKNWTNAENEVVTKINKGTIGNITLRANWLSEENLATPTDDNKPEGVVFDETLNRYYFIYEMGVIDNIVIGIVESQDKSTMESLTFSKSNTISIENSISDTVASTISESISKTSGWSKSCDLARSYSQTLDASISAGLEVEEFGVKGKIETELGVSETFAAGVTLDYGKHSSKTVGSTSEHSVSSTVAYAKGQSTTVTATSTIDGAMPKGTYRYVVVAKVTVYAIVTYDITTGNYHLDTYSVMDDDLRDKRLYEAPSDTTANITTNDALSFDISNKDFKNYIDSSYYVKYDANGGRGKEMLLSVFSVNGEYALSPNEYVRDGYTFIGWSLVKNDSANVYTDQDVVSNIANGGELVVLYAQWTNNKYKVLFDANGGSVSIKETTVMYDNPYGELPTPTRTGYTFNGWTLDGQIVYKSTTVKQLENKTMVAKWVANVYNVNYNANGGNGNYNDSVTYDGNYTIKSGEKFSRANYAFLGWSLNPSATIPDFKVNDTLTYTFLHDYTLYAVWTPTKSSWNNGLSDSNYMTVRNDGLEYYLQTGLNREALREAGYTTISISGTIRGQRIYSMGSYNWYIEFYDRNNTKIHSDEIGKFNTSFETRNIQYTFSIDCIRDDGTVKVRFDHMGGSNDRGQYRIGMISITSTAM